VVLSKEEVWAMLTHSKLLKHKMLIGLLYGCGLRCFEARNVRLGNCKTGTLITLLTFDGRGPPKNYFSVLPSNSLNN
jgi:integrase